MSRLNEIFVESINKAVASADVMTDINQKPIAYASIANALAVYLTGDNKTVSVETQVKDLSNNNVANVQDELRALQQENEKVANAINDTIEEHITAVDDPFAEKKEEVKSQWVLPYDENGIPYLNQEDFCVPERVLAYENALTPEIEAKKREIEIQIGQAILNEDTEQVSVQQPVQETPTVQQPAEETKIEFTQEQLKQIEAYKISFDYANNPKLLDNLYHNFTGGIHSSLADVTPLTLEAFLLFVQEQLSNANAKLEEWKNSWITKEGLDNLLAEAYQTPGATIETHICEANIFWFLEYVDLYSANAWFNSYLQQLGQEQMTVYVRDYLDESSATLDRINNENVIGLINYIQTMIQQSA